MNDREGPEQDAENEPALEAMFEAVAADAQAYLATQKALITLDLSERGGRMAASAVWLVVAVLLVSLGVGLLAVALGLYLGRVFQDVVLGFLAAAGIFFLVTALFYLIWRRVLRDRIILAVINAAHAKPEHLP